MCSKSSRIRPLFAFGQHQEIGTKQQFAFGTLGRVLQLQRAASRIAGIGKGFFSLCHALPIHRLESLEGVHHLTAHLKVVGIIATQTQRDRGDCACISGNIITHSAVAASGRLHQFALAICEADGNTVVLQFACIAERNTVEQFACT